MNTALVLLGMGLLADAQNATVVACSARVAHELSSLSGNVTLMQGSAVVVTAGLKSLSSYGFIDCASTSALYLVDDMFKPVAGVILHPDVAVTSYTILAYIQAGTGNAETEVFPDLSISLPEDPASISAAAVRVINAFTGSLSGVDVYGVSLNCYNCARPYLFSVPFGSANALTANWQEWYLPSTEYGVSFEIVPSGSSPLTVLPAASPRTGVSERDGGNGFAAELNLDEHGVYTIIVHEGATISWSVSTDVPGRDQWLPVLFSFLALVGVAVAYQGLAYFLERLAQGTEWGATIAQQYTAKKGTKGKSTDVTLIRFLGLDKRIAKAVIRGDGDRARSGSGSKGARGSVNDDDTIREGLLGGMNEIQGRDAEGGATADSVTSAVPASTKPLSSGRFLSLDTFRGLSLTIMAFVNYGAGNYTFLDHMAWNGMHLADFVFPWFVWMSGVSMALSFDAARRRGATPSDLAWKIAARSAKLFALGLFMNGGAVLAQWRIPGVLQYFAVSNLIVGLVESLCHPTGKSTEDDDEDGGDGRDNSFLGTLRRDLTFYWVQWLIMLSLLGIYLLIQSFMVLPAGCPRGYIGPGGLGDNGAYMGMNCTGGAHRALDMAIFGANHIYHHTSSNGIAMSSATCSGPYQCDVHDPEGALGWLTASWMVWFGLQAGRVLVNYKREGRVDGQAGVQTSKLVKPYLSRLISWGSTLCLLGGALCGFAKEGGILPLNKNLWSPSFVAVLSGLGFFWLATLWTVVDHFRVWSGSPFRYVGMNSLAFYILHETYQAQFPFTTYTSYPGFGNKADWYSHSESLGSIIAGVACWVAVSRYLYVKGIFFNL